MPIVFKQIKQKRNENGLQCFYYDLKLHTNKNEGIDHAVDEEKRVNCVAQ